MIGLTPTRPSFARNSAMVFSFQSFTGGMARSSLRPSDRSSGDGARVVRERLAQSPTDDALGRDPEHLWIKAGPDLRAAGVQDFCVAPDLDALHTPGVHRGDVVD